MLQVLQLLFIKKINTMEPKIINIKYLNPWYAPDNKQAQKFFYREKVKRWKSKCGKGKIIEVVAFDIFGSDAEYKDGHGHYDYLINNHVVTQRAGNSMEELEKYIKYILYNGKYFLGADRIKKAYEIGVQYGKSISV